MDEKILTNYLRYLTPAIIELVDAAKDIEIRSERARGILTNGKNDCWSMLDTVKLCNALKPFDEQ